MPGDGECLVSVNSSIEAVDLNDPAIDFTHGRRVVGEFPIGILFHNNIKGLSLLLRVFNKFNRSITQNAAVFHAI